MVVTGSRWSDPRPVGNSGCERTSERRRPVLNPRPVEAFITCDLKEKETWLEKHLVTAASPA